MLVTREPGGSEGAEANPRAAAERQPRTAGARGPKLCCSPRRAPTMSKRPSRPALEAGSWVLSDRFVDSSLAYQGGAGGLGIEAVRAINAFGIGDCFPDRTLVLIARRGRGARAGPRRRRQRPHRRPPRRLSPQGRDRLPASSPPKSPSGSAGRCVRIAASR